MTTRDLLLGVAVAAVSALVAIQFGLLGPAAMIGVILVALAFRYPALLLPGVIAGILFSNAGLFPTVRIVVPLTLAKLTTLAAIVIGGAHAWYYRRPLFRWTSVSLGFIAVGLSIALSIAASGGDILAAAGDVIGFITLALLAHLIVVWVPRAHLDQVLVLTAITLVGAMAVSIALSDPIENPYTDRSSGVYDNPNNWAAILVWLVPTVIGATRGLGGLGLALSALLLLLYPINIALTLSRSGLIAALAGAPLLIYAIRKHVWLLGILGVITLVTLPTFADPAQLTERYSTLLDEEAVESDGSIATRATAMRTGIQLFQEHPLFGVGVGRFRYEALDRSGGLVDIVPHNTYTGTAAEQGLFGLLAYAFLGILVVEVLWAGWKNSANDPDQRAAIAGGMASLVGGAAMAVAGDMRTFPVVYAWLGIMLIRVGPVRRGVSATRPQTVSTYATT